MSEKEKELLSPYFSRRIDDEEHDYENTAMSDEEESWVDDAAENFINGFESEQHDDTKLYHANTIDEAELDDAYEEPVQEENAYSPEKEETIEAGSIAPEQDYQIEGDWTRIDQATQPVEHYEESNEPLEAPQDDALTITTKITKSTTKEIYSLVCSNAPDMIAYLLLALAMLVFGVLAIYLKNMTVPEAQARIIMYISIVCAAVASLCILEVTLFKSKRLEKHAKALMPYTSVKGGIKAVVRFEKYMIDVQYPKNGKLEKGKHFRRKYKDVEFYQYTDNYLLIACKDRVIPIDIDKADDNDIEMLLLEKNPVVREKASHTSVIGGVLCGIAFVIMVIGILDYVNIFPEITSLIDHIFDLVMEKVRTVLR